MLGIKTLLKGYVKPGPPCGRTHTTAVFTEGSQVFFLQVCTT
jgi:hypothetical protein